MPYLVLKALWLSGSAVGARNPALNGVTVVLDLFVIARVPTWPILLSGWVGTGFLLSLVLAILPPNIPTPIRTGRTRVIPPPPSVEQLTRALSAVGHLIAGIRDDQWSAHTPCTDWTVHDLVNHLVGVNLVFAALLSDQTPPDRGADHLGGDPAAAYRDSGVAVQTAFDQPGVLERIYHGPLGVASGAERLHVRIADLLAHGWDLARATGQPAELPEDLAEQALAFTRAQLSTMPRTGRFGPAQTVADDAPAIDRLVAFLGRPVSAGR